MKHPKVLLTIVYYIVLILVIVSAMVSYNIVYNKGIYLAAGDPRSVIAYSVILWYVIISLPLALKGFSVGVKRLKNLPDDGAREYYYSILGVARIALISIGLIASICGVYFIQDTSSKSLIWLAGISAIGLIMCKPTAKKVEDDLASIMTDEIDDETDTEETNKPI
ncbi:MAG: hypothetical protein R3Y59_10635 [bacterium]